MATINAPATVRAPRKGESWHDWIKAHKDQPVTIGILGAAVDQLIHHLKVMSQQNVERNLRLDTLEAKTRELETKALEYKGVWDPAITYQRGDVVTRDGGMWFSKLVSTGIRPGDSPSHWQLSVRRGADGKDLR